MARAPRWSPVNSGMRMIVLGVALVAPFAGGPASAQAPPEEGSPAAARDDGEADATLTEVGALARAAQAKYEIAQFEEAAELWSRAYRRLPEGPEAREYRGLLAYQISGAYREAYRTTGSPASLRRAIELMERYVTSLGDDDEDAEARLDAQEELAALRRELEEIEPETPPPVDEPASDRAARPLRIAGVAASTAGVGLLAAMTVGLVQGDRVDDEGAAYIAGGGSPNDADVAELDAKGRRANRLALGAGIAGGAVTAAGLALVTVAGLRARRPRGAAVRAAVAPAGGWRWYGVAFSARF